VPADQHELILVLRHQVSNIHGKVAEEAGMDMSDIHALRVPWPVQEENNYPVLVNEVSAARQPHSANIESHFVPTAGSAYRDS
jgi:hypothetical protein